MAKEMNFDELFRDELADCRTFGTGGTLGNKRTNTHQLGALRASLVRPDQRRVIFGNRLKRAGRLEYPRPFRTPRNRSNTEPDIQPPAWTRPA